MHVCNASGLGSNATTLIEINNSNEHKFYTTLLEGIQAA